MLDTLTYVSVVALAALSAYVYPSIRHELKVLGVGRAIPQTTIPDSADYIKIEDTYHCEDLHHYTPANLLFAACEDRPTRFSWFPPLHNFEPPVRGTQGSFHVIDPEVCGGFSHVLFAFFALPALKEENVLMEEPDKSQTKKSIRLSFENFDDTFVTHGIDVITDPKDDKAVYIFAVNHQPSPEFASSRRKHITKSNSRIEIFRYKIGSPTIKHVRTVADARIETPNDIYAVSPTELYVTNDHAYREGMMRGLEMIAPVGWSNTLFISITHLDASSSPSAGLQISTALTGIKSNNGLGHVHNSNEITVISAERGILYRCFPENGVEGEGMNGNGMLKVRETIHMDSTLDNPSWYHDSWASSSSSSSKNTSGYVLAGLARGIDLAANANKKPDAHVKDPPYVWLVQPSTPTSTPTSNSNSNSNNNTTRGNWQKRLIFADDGSKMRTASAAVIVGIDPKKEGGKKRGWLFVTGFMSENMLAVKIDL